MWTMSSRPNGRDLSSLVLHRDDKIATFTLGRPTLPLQFNPLRRSLWALRHSFGELKLISSKFSYTQHSANKFASVFVCTNFPVIAKLVPMSVTQVYLQVTKRVQPSFANAVHCYGIAMPTLKHGDNSNAYKCNFKNKTGMVLSNS